VGLSPALPSPGIDVEAAAIASLDRSQVQAALRRLEGRDQVLLVLRYWEDQPVEAIARSLGMSEGATKVALLRARRALKERLKAREGAGHAL
jgi:RNA polymerase sigma factor (sigma-70 family)